ncbi:MAG TPA: beta family protein [Rhizomicrobium sp.]|jgi:hypothetical protein
MPLRALSQATYIPHLSIRPAEMQGLEELPERDKDGLFPFFSLRSWVSAHNLDSSLIRLEDAYGSRAFFIGVCDAEFIEKRRDVHDELDELRDADDGYSNWCDFIEQHANFIPAVQLAEPDGFDAQVSRLHEFGRGLLVPIKHDAFPLAQNLALRTSALTNQGRDVCFFLDFGKATSDLPSRQMITTGVVNGILAAAPRARVAISASSFPDSFADLDHQEIYERMLFNGVRAAINDGRLVYSDRGSARVERLGGGGGTIPPRVDYAEPARWTFFRADAVGDKFKNYQKQAKLVMKSPGWDARLRLWGTQMIERTAMGDRTAISSQAKATAVRINLHLHRQLFYDDPQRAYDTDEEWRD